jgi:uncharacterized membrane protein YdbT with pleckstrin-like domain
VLPESPNKHQKKRISKYLSSGEKLIYVTSIGKQYFLINLFIFLVIPLIFTYGGIFIFFGYIGLPLDYPWLRYIGIPGLLLLIYNTPKYSHLLRMRQSYTYALTDKRFMIIRGIFARKIITAPLVRITHVTVEQSFFQRFLFNSGHLVIITAGYDQREIVIENISDPVKFKIWIDELTENIEGIGDVEIEDEDEEDNDKPKKFKLRALKT